MERAVLLCEGSSIRARDLRISPAASADPTALGALNLRLPAVGIKLEDPERLAILESLRMHDWVQKDAARFLGISSRAMNYKIAKYQIKNSRWSKNREVG